MQPRGELKMPAPGERVLVPTQVEAGAFPNEKLVTVETQEGPISGFARADLIVQQPTGQYLVAEVKAITEGSVTVKIFGSFFTTTGLAIVAPGMLKATG
jgi:hypothetical protein